MRNTRTADTNNNGPNPVCDKMIGSVKHVLLITPWYSETETGGVAIATQNITAALIEAELKVTVLVPAGDGWRAREIRGDHGERVIYLPIRSQYSKAGGLKASIGYYLRLPGLRRTLRQLHNEAHIDIAHFNFSAEEYGELMTELDRLGIRYVATFHGSDVAVAYDWVPLGDVTKRIVRQARYVALVSGALKRTLEGHEPSIANRTRIIYNCAPADCWNDNEDAESAKRDVDLLYLGGLLPVKGPDILLDAYQMIREQRPQTILTIVGDGPLREALEQRAATGEWSDRVTFTGRVSRRDVLKWYRRARIVALPSRSEGLPLVAMEASLAGAAIVGTSVGGIPEAVVDGQTGLIVPPEDPEALATALLKMLDDPDFTAAAGRKAVDHARSLFSQVRMAAGYIDLYTKALEDTGR